MKCFRKRHLLQYILTMPALVFVASCGIFFPKTPPPPRNETKTILFKCDSAINRGMLLPVDVIYVTANDNLKELTQIGPAVWFDSKERDGWPHKQALNLQGGLEIRLRLDKPPETTHIVIFASFFEVDDQDSQQVILLPVPEKGEGAEEEVVWVGAQSLYH